MCVCVCVFVYMHVCVCVCETGTWLDIIWTKKKSFGNIKGKR